MILVIAKALYFCSTYVPKTVKRETRDMVAGKIQSFSDMERAA